MIRTRSDKKSLSTLIKELDKVFSEWTRRVEAIDGKITCIICGSVIPWRDADAAHVLDRDNMATRFHPLNVWPTDQGCNRFDDNHRDRFKHAVINLIGYMEFEQLEALSHSLQKWHPWELQEKIDFYKAEIKKLK